MRSVTKKRRVDQAQDGRGNPRTQLSTRASASVSRMSLRARPSTRAEWTPTPGVPSAFANGQLEEAGAEAGAGARVPEPEPESEPVLEPEPA